MRLLSGVALLTVIVSGCSVPIRTVDRLPVAADLPSAAEPELIIAHASEDIELLKAKKEPRYAVYDTGLYDGGTRFFNGSGYRIIDHRKFVTKNGQKGQILGQTIIFEREVTSGKEIEFSTAAFVPSDK